MKENRSPWAWIPTLYMFEGLPNAIVNTVSLAVFKDMGMPNDKVTLYASLLSFPWVLKIILSPFVDSVGTKRMWALLMQVLMVASVMALGILLPHTALGAILMLFCIVAFASATHDIAADGYYMLELDAHAQSLFVGVRNTFFRLALLFGQGILAMIAGVFQGRLGMEVSRAWASTLCICALVLAVMTLWNVFCMPQSINDSRRKGNSLGDMFGELGASFVSFFSKKGIALALVFLLLYRLPEALSMKMLIPFMKDPISSGGLGMDNTQIGMVYGTVGTLALLAGGILGGIVAARYGLKRCLWPMAMSLALPCSVYLYLSMVQPSGLFPVAMSIAVDQFGYGFGFTAYTLYMLYFSRGKYQTSHYAFCTVFMTFSMMLPGFVAGKIQMSIGYPSFFVLVMVCCLATAAVTALIKVDSEYGKK